MLFAPHAKRSDWMVADTEPSHCLHLLDVTLGSLTAVAWDVDMARSCGA